MSGNNRAYRLAVENLPDGFACFQIIYNEQQAPLDFVFRDTNRAFEEITGLKRENVQGRKITEVLADSEIDSKYPQLAQYVQAVMEGETLHFEYYSETLNRWYEIISYSEEEDTFIVLFRNITDHKKVQEEMQQQLEFEKMVAEISSSFVNTPANQFDQAVNRALELTGEFFDVDVTYVMQIRPEENLLVITHDWVRKGIEQDMESVRRMRIDELPWIGPRYRDLEKLKYSNVEDLPPEAEMEKTILQKKGVKSVLICPLVTNGTQVGALGIHSIREKKEWNREQESHLKVLANTISSAFAKQQMESALKESEEQFRSFVENASDIIFTVNEKGILTYISPNWTAVLGHSEEEIVGAHFSEIVHPDDIEACFKAIEEITNKGYLEKPVEYRTKQKNGGYRWFAAKSSLIKKEENETLFVGIARDIQERKQVEERLYRIEWMLRPKKLRDDLYDASTVVRSYGDLSELNDYGPILESVGKELLMDIARDFADLLGTSTIIYEKNGDHAFSMHVSSWCRYLDCVSREFCSTADNRAAMQSGKWWCHESDWRKAAALAIKGGQPVDTVCSGGIRIYSVPIWVYGEVAGAINMSYGDPPRDEASLQQIAEIYQVQVSELLQKAEEYETRPPFMVELAKERLHSSARLIGSMVERKQAEQKLVENEEKYRLIFENAPIGILHFDEKGTITACNNNFVQIIGSSRDALIGLNMLELPDKKLVAAVKEALQGRTGYYEDNYRSVTSNKVTPVKVLFAPFNRKESNVTTGGVGIVEDVTERKKFEEELRKSEERYREILASIEEGYFEVDLAGNVTFFNEAINRTLGYAPEEFMGMNYKNLHRDSNHVFKRFNRVYLTGEADSGLTTEMHCRDGSTKFIELSVSPVRDERNRVTGFRGVARDITERIRYEEQLKHLSLHDQLTGLYNRAYFENELKRLSGSREYPVSVISADLDGLKLVNDTLGHEKGDELLKACAVVLQESLRSYDILARVGGDEFVAILPRTDKQTAEEVVERIRRQVMEYNARENTVPLSLSMGISTAEKEGRALQETFKEADDLMYRDKLHKGAGAKSQIIKSLMVTLGERDFITQGHAKRLENFCRKVGEKIRLPSKKISDLVLLAQVHDLGKVGIPDRILFKKGPLDEEEWEVMCKHPEKGYRIALSSPDLAGIADLILKHHERWDGKGYPLGIQGEEIPIECRILAIIDAFDAMTSDRPYRNALGQDEAVAELRSCAGSQFDPYLVDVFLSVLEMEYS